jgi:hypothetical protein
MSNVLQRIATKVYGREIRLKPLHYIFVILVLIHQFVLLFCNLITVLLTAFNHYKIQELPIDYPDLDNYFYAVRNFFHERSSLFVF